MLISTLQTGHCQTVREHFTRRSELGKLKASDVDNFTIYALKDEIIDGEDEISDELTDKKKQDIHAKIYLRRKYSDVDLYLGSMNASYSAINKNVEMMLWLGTKNMYLNGDKFLEDIFCGPAQDVKNPFEQVTVADAVLEKHPDEFGSEREQSLLWLNRNKINKYEELPKTNARLEALKEKAFTGGAEKYLWIPPSLPYYEMQGAYKNSKGFSKILVFSACIF